MNITIVGAGNIGPQFAVHCAEKGHSVTVYTSKPGKIAKELYIVNEYGKENVQLMMQQLHLKVPIWFSLLCLPFVCRILPIRSFRIHTPE